MTRDHCTMYDDAVAELHTGRQKLRQIFLGKKKTAQCIFAVMSVVFFSDADSQNMSNMLTPPTRFLWSGHRIPYQPFESYISMMEHNLGVADRLAHLMECLPRQGLDFGPHKCRAVLAASGLEPAYPVECHAQRN